MDIRFAYRTFIEICGTCRRSLINDTLKGTSTDLYGALYSDADSEIFRIRLELYELEWIAFHWEQAAKQIEDSNLSNQEKRELLALFAKYFTPFLSHWNYSEFDPLIFKEKEDILRAIIFANDAWEENLEKMKVSFAQSKKLLKAKIREFERMV